MAHISKNVKYHNFLNISLIYFVFGHFFIFIEAFVCAKTRCDIVVFVLLVVINLQNYFVEYVFIMNPGSFTDRHKPNPPGDASGSRRRD